MAEIIKLDADFVQDPHGLYDRLRAEAPVTAVVMPDGVRAWLITSYAEALAALNDPRFTTNPRHAQAQVADDRARPFDDAIFDNMLLADPPEHTRLRKLVVKAFTARAIERMQLGVEAIADDLLDVIGRRDTSRPVDLVADYAGPLPIRVICELLGMPTEYAERFRATFRPLVSIATNETKAIAARETMTILCDLVAYKRTAPGEDLLTTLIGASSDGDRLSDPELVTMASLLITAGHESTVHLIANTVLTLLQNPLQLQAVREDSSLIPNVIEEVLRFDGPANLVITRYSTANVPVGDVVIPRGDVVLIAVLSANRDGDRFDDPDRFDITRSTRGHLGFGYGMHRCVGASLARMEGTIALRKLLDRYGHIELDRTTPLRYQNSINAHGISALPVRLRHDDRAGT